MTNYDPLLDELICHDHSGSDVTGGDIGAKVPINSIQFDITPTAVTPTEGLLNWNATDGTLDLGMDGGDITQQIGQEMFMKVRNVSGSAIANGSPVYISGRTGNRPNIYLAKSDSETTSKIVGLTTQDIASPDDGFVTTFGYVRQIKTDYSGAGVWGTTWVEGDNLYVSKTVAGQLTNVEPTAPHHSDIVGTVAIVGGTGIGSILVRNQKHVTLEELTDVDGTPLATTGQFPVWNQTAGYFDFNENINNFLRLDASNDPITGDLKLVPTSNSTTTFQIFKQDGTTNVLNVDTTNGRVGIGTAVPSQALHIEDGKLLIKGTVSDGRVIHFSRLQETYGSASNYIVGYDESDGFMDVGIGFNTGGLRLYTQSETKKGGSVRLSVLSTGLVGIDVAVPTNSLSFGGNSARTIALERHTTANTAGNNLTVQAGGATSGATDKSGGSLTLSGGVSTGTGTSRIIFQSYNPAASTGTADNSAVTAAILYKSTTTAFSFILNNTSTGMLGHGISIYGNGAASVGLVRHTTANTAGNNLTVQAGGAASGATDKAGGTLILKGGISTGTQRGSVQIYAYGNGTTGTSDNTSVLCASIFNGSNNTGDTYFNISGLPATATGAVGANSFNVTGIRSGGYYMYRNSTADTAGNILTVQAGGAALSATDKNGGDLTLKSGISTGTGTSTIILQTPTPAGSTGTSDNAFATRVSISSTGTVIGSTTDNSTFEADGTLVFNGTATVFDDLNFDPSSSGGPPTTLPDYVDINNVIHREFTSSNNQLCGDGEELPHSYKLSSTIYPHVHVFLKSGESAGTTGVTFTLYWELRQSTGTTSGSVSLAATSAQLGTTAGANKLDIYDATGFAGSAELGGQLTLKLARTAGDAGDVVVTTYGVHYEKDMCGSHTASTK